MKEYKIEKLIFDDKDNIIGVEKILTTNNIGEFCNEHNLTIRLLNYTFTGQRRHHKGYRLVNRNRTVEETKPNTDNIKNLGTVDIASDNICYKALEKERKKTQRLQDELRLIRKGTRENNRLENMIEDIKKEFSEEIKKDLKLPEKYELPKGYQSLVVCLSDWHIGQLVNTHNNYFDFETAKQRVITLFDNVIDEIITRDVTDVYIGLLGDFIHSQCVYTKPDMKIASEFSEIPATMKAYKLIYSQIDRVLSLTNVKLFSVCGNESRFASYMKPSNLDEEFSNSLDYMIYELLRERYSDVPTVEFLNDSKQIEDFVEIEGLNFSITHGHNLNHKNLQEEVRKMNMRLEKSYHIKIDYALLGHIHQTLITDTFSRNSSLVGCNAYSNSLNIVEGIPAQNILVIQGDSIKAFSIQL